MPEENGDKKSEKDEHIEHDVPAGGYFTPKLYLQRYVKEVKNLAQKIFNQKKTNSRIQENAKNPPQFSNYKFPIKISN